MPSAKPGILVATNGDDLVERIERAPFVWTHPILLKAGAQVVAVSLRRDSVDLQIDICEPPCAARNGLEFVVPADAAIPAQLKSLDSFDRLSRGLAPRCVRSGNRVPGLVRQLRVLDATAEGASHRDIAHVLFPRTFDAGQWRDRNCTARSAVRRLIRVARANVAGGYRTLLG